MTLRAKPKCENAEKHTSILSTDWVGCKPVPGECGWLRQNGKCPKQQEHPSTKGGDR